MLEIVRYGEDEYDFPCLLVLGCFDGLHIGHMDLLKKAKLQAKINGLDLGVMMFVDGKGGKQVYSFEERASILEQYNVKFILKIDFNDDFKKIKPLDFLACLEDKLNVKAYMSGKDFRFGCDKKGKSSTLKSYADDEDNGVWYMPVKDVVYNGDKVSTTMIKSLLAQGNIKLANELLGRAYSVTGKIVHGANRGGNVLGCPTINVVYPDFKFEVQQGVYKVECKIDDKTYTGVANYGARPTFEENEVLLEVNLDDCNEDLYGKTATVYFIDYIRDIEKFDSPEKLSEQIQKDKQAQGELAATDSVEETLAQETAVDEEYDEPLITVSDIIGDDIEDEQESDEQPTETPEAEEPTPCHPEACRRISPNEQPLEQTEEHSNEQPNEETVNAEIPVQPDDNEPVDLAAPAEEQSTDTPEADEQHTETPESEEPAPCHPERSRGISPNEQPLEETENQEITEQANDQEVIEPAEQTEEQPVQPESRETPEEIEQANNEFEAELAEEISVPKDEIKEVDAHKARKLSNIIEEIKLEADKTENTEDTHSEIISEQIPQDDENDD